MPLAASQLKYANGKRLRLSGIRTVIVVNPGRRQPSGLRQFAAPQLSVVRAQVYTAHWMRNVPHHLYLPASAERES
jgi:hypothetical protein